MNSISEIKSYFSSNFIINENSIASGTESPNFHILHTNPHIKVTAEVIFVDFFNQYLIVLLRKLRGLKMKTWKDYWWRVNCHW